MGYKVFTEVIQSRLSNACGCPLFNAYTLSRYPQKDLEGGRGALAGICSYMVNSSTQFRRASGTDLHDGHPVVSSLSCNVYTYAYYRYRMLFIFFTLATSARSLPLTLRYSMFYYYNWVRIGLTGEIRGYNVLLHILLETAFSAFQGVCGLDGNGGCGILYSGHHQITKRQPVITISRGPMARKKWSREQLLHRTTEVTVHARLYSNVSGNVGLLDYSTSVGLLRGLVCRDVAQSVTNPTFNLQQSSYLVSFILSRDFMAHSIVNYNVYSAARLCVFFKKTLFNMESNLAQLRTVTFKPTFCDFFFFSVL